MQLTIGITYAVLAMAAGVSGAALEARRDLPDPGEWEVTMYESQGCLDQIGDAITGGEKVDCSSFDESKDINWVKFNPENSGRCGFQATFYEKDNCEGESWHNPGFGCTWPQTGPGWKFWEKPKRYSVKSYKVTQNYCQ